MEAISSAYNALVLRPRIVMILACIVLLKMKVMW